MTADFCHPIRSIRKKLKMSQTKLAEQMGITQKHLSHCELYFRNLSVKPAKKLITFAKSRGIHCTLDFIYKDVQK